MKKVKYIVLLAMLLLALLAVRTFLGREKTPPIPAGIEQEEIAIPVEAEKVLRLSVTETITAIGNIEPFKTVVIYPEATGILEKLTVKEGDFLEKGSFIASIENQERRLNVQQAKIEIQANLYQMENIRQDYNRHKRLYEEGAVAAKSFEDVETLYNATREKIKGLEKQLEIAERRLKDTSIFAPISGIVAEKFIDEGELVTESTMSKSSPLISIIDISRVKITVPLGEEDIRKVREGQKVSFETDVYRGENFYGRIDKIMPVTDLSTRTTTVEIIADNPSRRLKPGMFTRALIETGSREVLAVSLDALLKMPSSGNYYCFTVDGQTARKTSVEVGAIWNGMAEIKSGLKEGDGVVVTSQGILETGKKIKASFVKEQPSNQ